MGVCSDWAKYCSAQRRQGFALDGRNALIAFGVRALINGHDEQAFAQQGAGPGARKAARHGRHAFGVEPAVSAQQPFGVVVGHHIGHGPVALGLDDQASFEFQAGAHQGGQHAGLAQQIRYRLGVIVAAQDVVDHSGQPRDAAAHGPAFDLEDRDQVFAVGGQRDLGGLDWAHAPR